MRRTLVFASAAPDQPRWKAAQMAAQVGIERVANFAHPNLNEKMRYLASQPILDSQGRVHGYELLFRKAPQEVLLNAETGVETTLGNQVIFGLERLTNGQPAFVTCTAEAIIEGWVLVLVPMLTVLSLPAALNPTPKLLNACESLKTRGFHFALDGLRWDNMPNPLLQLADYIRVDFRWFCAGDWQQLLQRLQNSVTLVAQKVETIEDHLQAKAMGFTLFQGDYFCQPVLHLHRRKLTANRLAHRSRKSCDIIVAVQGHNPSRLIECYLDCLDLGRTAGHDVEANHRHVPADRVDL
jgi:c-di-GMP-related signal transduction protein